MIDVQHKEVRQPEKRHRKAAGKGVAAKVEHAEMPEAKNAVGDIAGKIHLGKIELRDVAGACAASDTRPCAGAGRGIFPAGETPGRVRYLIFDVCERRHFRGVKPVGAASAEQKKREYYQHHDKAMPLQIHVFLLSSWIFSLQKKKKRRRRSAQRHPI
eukprot:TRINITY_DN29343_c0_g1_i1.p3 TRINITY_DN29343_c0_g1~~TRINITY_DN29343_c0_g1_i1.p3  ORF type:complete len:158 (+),score=4.06 TRINITY_DN29343_c0_g1_i1:1407-1880(+)